MRFSCGAVVLGLSLAGCAPVDDPTEPTEPTVDEAIAVPTVRVFADETNVRTAVVLPVGEPLAVEFQPRSLATCGAALEQQRIARVVVLYQSNGGAVRRAAMGPTASGWFRARLPAPREAGRLSLRFEATNSEGCLEMVDNRDRGYAQPIVGVRAR